MNNWNAGYNTDAPYTFGYFSELNPLRSQFLLLLNNLEAQEVKTACELGYGHGVSINMHRAASDVKWYGTDFLSDHYLFAKKISDLATNDLQIYDQSFADFATRTDLPDFDFIGLHGVWSWINQENHEILRSFIAKKLKPGGILYISYNTSPGRYPFIPIRDLMREWCEHLGQGQDIIAQVPKLLNFLEEIVELAPQYLEGCKIAKANIKGLKDKNPTYLAHEYLNENWHITSIREMVDYLSEAKLSYLGSANFVYQPLMILENKYKNYLEKIADPIFRESIADFIFNTGFRWDYYVKGKAKLSEQEKIEALNPLKFILSKNINAFNYKCKLNYGEVELEPSRYQPIIELLSDYKAHSFAEIMQVAKKHSIKDPIDCITMLFAIKVIARAKESTSAIRERCDKLNGYIMQKMVTELKPSIDYLTSPTLGGGVQLSDIIIFFLFARRLHPDNYKIELWAKTVLEIFKNKGCALKNQNTNLPLTDSESLEFLQKAGKEFAEQLYIVEALEIR